MSIPKDGMDRKNCSLVQEKLFKFQDIIKQNIRKDPKMMLIVTDTGIASVDPGTPAAGIDSTTDIS